MAFVTLFPDGTLAFYQDEALQGAPLGARALPVGEAASPLTPALYNYEHAFVVGGERQTASSSSSSSAAAAASASAVRWCAAAEAPHHAMAPHVRPLARLGVVGAAAGVGRPAASKAWAFTLAWRAESGHTAWSARVSEARGGPRQLTRAVSVDALQTQRRLHVALAANARPPWNMRVWVCEGGTSCH